MSILLTGATGFIGSHAWVELQRAGYDVVGIDNFSNSAEDVLERLGKLIGAKPEFRKMDVRDVAGLVHLMTSRQVDAVVHFAALKSVSESAFDPLNYYQNNIGGLLSVCKAMDESGVSRMVFSSSATVYGDPESVPVPESAVLRPASTYGRTKMMGESILKDMERARPEWQIACLRYFNPVGAHPSGLIGEDPRGTPNNLMPLLGRVATGTTAALDVYGDDYPTADGTGVRDYVHVVDLAQAHVAALAHLQENHGSLTVNIGTGVGYSVFDVITAYEKASGKTIPYHVKPRREGDVAAYYADPTLAKELLGWEAELGLEQMCADSWRRQCES